jgi:hypothetical protein
MANDMTQAGVVTFSGKIMAAIIVTKHFNTPDDLFGTPQGSPRSEKMIGAAVQWAEQILKKIDRLTTNPEERKGWPSN